MAELQKIPKECVSDSTLCLFFYHGDCRRRPHGHSLFGIDISVADNERGFEINNPRVLVQLVLPKREGLLCVKCGSKVYFLGGLFGLDDGDPPQEYECPPDVLVFDPTDPHNFTRHPSNRTTKIAPMNSGKVYGTAFAVNGKLYALGGRQPWLCPSDFNDENYCVFEVYDPAKNRWKKLQGPPVKPGSRYSGDPSYGFSLSRSFVISPRRVLIVGSFPSIFTYDTVADQWSTFARPSASSVSHDLFVNDYFYGVYSLPTYGVSKLGPCFFPEDGQRIVLPESNADLEWESSESNFLFDSSTDICHLGDTYFCIIEAATSPAPGYRNKDGLARAKPSYLHCRFNLIFIKELQGDQDCFEVEFLQQAPFEFTTTRGHVLFRGFHLMSAEGFGDKHTETNLEGENERTHVDFTNIQTNQKLSVEGISLNEVMDYLLKMRLVRKDVMQVMQKLNLC